MKAILNSFKPHRGEALLAPLFKLMEAALELLVPLVVASIIDDCIPAGDTGGLLLRGGLLAAFALVGLALAFTAQYFSAKAATGVSKKLRSTLFDKVQSFGCRELDAQGTPELITRLTSDVDSVQAGINLTLRLLLRSPFVVLGAMAVAFTIDARCALVFVAVIAVLLGIVFAVLLAAIPAHSRAQSALDGVSAKSRENLAGVRVIRAFRMEESEKTEFSRRVRHLEGLVVAAGRVASLLNPATLIVINIAAVALVYGGAVRVEAGVLSSGQVVALYSLLSQILVELIKTANLMITLARSLASARRIEAVIEAESGEGAGRANGKAPKVGAERGRLELKNVGFTYENAGAPALYGIDLTIDGGSTVGIIGGTGAGKTTLAELIAGLYVPTEGEIFLDGVSLAELDRSELGKRIAVVPQRASLITGSVRENLSMGSENVTDAALLHALELAQAGFVLEREGGLDAAVERAGRNFSGGQRQRLSIARALVKGGEVLILDDSASALDYATDAALRRALEAENAALKAAGKGRTTLVISQRVDSIRSADRIIVLDDGGMAGFGAHAELMKTCPVYREIVLAQSAEEASA